MAIAPLEDEAEVLARVAVGDERAFARLFLWYADPLGNFVQRLTQSTNITEEIIQDVFVTIWLRRDKLLEIRTFHHYLFILCRNQTYARLKAIASERVKQLNIVQQQRVYAEWDQLESPSDAYRQQLEQVVRFFPSRSKR